MLQVLLSADVCFPLQSRFYCGFAAAAAVMPCSDFHTSRQRLLQQLFLPSLTMFLA
jgi:hypothetical protein